MRRLLFDENVDGRLARRLRADGHDVVSVQDIESRADDQRVTALATELDRILVTGDKDFGELVMRQQLPVPGVLLLRIPPADRLLTPDRVSRLLAKHPERLFGNFTVLQTDRIRIRPLVIRRVPGS